MADLSTSGTKTLPAAGSQPVAIATSQGIGSIIIYNPTGNSTVYFGDATHTSSNGIPLAAGQWVSIDIGDIGQVYVSGTQNDVVRFYATDKGSLV